MAEKKYLKNLLNQNSSGWKYEILEKAVALGRGECLEEIKRSGLRGRGGAGFSVSKKWSYVFDKKDVFLICNADEGEPGTFKDRYIMEKNPYVLIEGILIASYTLNAKKAYIYIRGEYSDAFAGLEKALVNSSSIMAKYKRESNNNDYEIILVKGAGAYICGDETSLINSIEGKRPISRLKPPYPAEAGLFGLPTVVNNVETIANIPLIIRDGGTYYETLGTEESKGTKLISLSGNVNRPGVYEVEFGKVTFSDIIYELGEGIAENNKLKFVIPGGISTKVLSASELDVIYDYKSLENAGTSLGSGAVIAVCENANVLEIAISVADFFMRETCGTCFPCKEGNRQIHHLLQKIKRQEGSGNIPELIKEISKTTYYSARCGLGQSSGKLIESTIDKFPEDFR